ncbi:MAG: hypothetical protein DRP46_10220 [Candidatus Zixiibacteriota bacterium]|nr:MAG: hypothetical protein DRP46_10220 [candidate division Zixibacteria bacterium]
MHSGKVVISLKRMVADILDFGAFRLCHRPRSFGTLFYSLYRHDTRGGFFSPISMIYVIVLYFDRRPCRENYTTLNLKREIAALMRKRIQQI